MTSSARTCGAIATTSSARSTHDKPYDRFVLEQLAGDQLADASALKRLGGDAAKLAEIRKKGHYTEDEAEMDRGHRLPPHGAVGQRDGEGRGSAADLPRRPRQRHRADVPRDHAALLQVPRSQVRSAADARLLPHLLRHLRHADGRASAAFSAGGKARRVRGRQGVRRADARLRQRREKQDRREARGGGARVVRGARPSLQGRERAQESARRGKAAARRGARSRRGRPAQGARAGRVDLAARAGALRADGAERL